MSGSIPSNFVSSNGIGSVSDANLNTLVQTDATAPQLRGFIGITGMAVVLQGITAAGDGGGGMFYWSVGSYSDDNFSVIVPFGAVGQGAWLRAALANPAGLVESFNTRIGAVTLESLDVTTALGYTPYNAASLISALAPYAPLAGPHFTGGAELDGSPLQSAATIAGGGDPAAFTTLSASANDALLYVNTSGQSIPNNALTTVTGWTKTDDRVNANFNATTGVFTAPATGYFLVSVQLCYASVAGVAGAFLEAVIVANSVGVATGASTIGSTSTSAYSVSATAVVFLTSGQTALIQAYQANGGSRSLVSSGTATYLSIARIP